ncbi:protein C1orf194 [Photinus pyralis]|uniref:protein C1orf194 n=1 Tax=Photinus pyralis TaxID=7054 RepID=UPI001266ED08|nr:protein C1orf194 [Photinus pyralis]
MQVIMSRRVRNKGCVPYLHTEGTITKKFPAKFECDGLRPCDRLYAHQTLASTRRSAYFKPFSHLIPADSLDFLLVSSYNHNTDLFGEKVIPCLQMETLGNTTWKRLRNTRDLDARPHPKSPPFSFSKLLSLQKEIEKYNNSHPVVIGGIRERDHLCHVKLMNSSHHAPQTNAGYCRQDRDGTFFQY